MTSSPSAIDTLLPTHRDLYYGGAWHTPAGGYGDTIDPATGRSLGKWARADARDVDAAARAARTAFTTWRDTPPAHRAALLRQVAAILRDHVEELALIDALNCGNPLAEMRRDIAMAASILDYCAGLVTELKGETIPMGAGVVNLSLREPYGVVARIVAYNHPLMFTAGKMGAALAAGNVVIMKPPEQAPLSSYRLMELIDGVFPPGVVNILTAGREGSEALVAHPLIPRVSLIGSVATGRAVARAGAERLKHITLELGGKNACVIYPDADLDRAAHAAVEGMNFTWCGQSCGSTSRLFIHASVHDAVMARVAGHLARYRPGSPTDPDTTMGAIISGLQYDKVMAHIDGALADGATLAHGGTRAAEPGLAAGFFIEPTVFTDVTQDMRIANEEVFGPVLSVLTWTDENDMFEQVNAVDYGLTAVVWTADLACAHRAAARIEAGNIWINGRSAHYTGALFGGYKQSGIGREEGLEELLSFTQVKNVHISY